MKQLKHHFPLLTATFILFFITSCRKEDTVSAGVHDEAYYKTQLETIFQLKPLESSAAQTGDAGKASFRTFKDAYDYFSLMGRGNFLESTVKVKFSSIKPPIMKAPMDDSDPTDDTGWPQNPDYAGTVVNYTAYLQCSRGVSSTYGTGTVIFQYQLDYSFTYPYGQTPAWANYCTANHASNGHTGYSGVGSFSSEYPVFTNDGNTSTPYGTGYVQSGKILNLMIGKVTIEGVDFSITITMNGSYSFDTPAFYAATNTIHTILTATMH